MTVHAPTSIPLVGNPIHINRAEMFCSKHTERLSFRQIVDQDLRQHLPKVKNPSNERRNTVCLLVRNHQFETSRVFQARVTIWNISCLPLKVRFRRDCTFDSAACVKDQHFTHTWYYHAMAKESLQTIQNGFKRHYRIPVSAWADLEYAVWSFMRIQRKALRKISQSHGHWLHSDLTDIHILC